MVNVKFCYWNFLNRHGNVGLIKDGSEQGETSEMSGRDVFLNKLMFSSTVCPLARVSRWLGSLVTLPVTTQE